MLSAARAGAALAVLGAGGVAGAAGRGHHAGRVAGAVRVGAIDPAVAVVVDAVVADLGRAAAGGAHRDRPGGDVAVGRGARRLNPVGVGNHLAAQLVGALRGEGLAEAVAPGRDHAGRVRAGRAQAPGEEVGLGGETGGDRELLGVAGGERDRGRRRHPRGIGAVGATRGWPKVRRAHCWLHTGQKGFPRARMLQLASGR